MTKTKGKGRLTKKPAVAAVAVAVHKAKGRKSPGRNRVNEETMALVEQGGPRISTRLSLKRKKSVEFLPVSCEGSSVFTSEPTLTGTPKKKKTELTIEQTSNNNCKPVETDVLKSSEKDCRSTFREDQAKFVGTADKTTSAVKHKVKTENEGPYEKMFAGLQSIDPLPSTDLEVLRDEKSDIHMINSFVMKYVQPNEEILKNALKDPVVCSIRNSLMERSQTFDHASQVQACLDKVAWENTLMKGVVGTLKSVDIARDEIIASLKADNQRLHNMLNEERSRFCVDWRNQDAERLVEETRKSAEEQNFYLKEQVHSTIDNLKSQYDNQLKELDEDRKKLAAENDSIHRRNERQRRVVEQLKKENEGYSKSSKLLSKYFSIMQWVLVRIAKDLQKSDKSVRTGFDFQLASLTSSLMDSLIGNGTNKIDFELSELEELGIKRLFESMKSKIKAKTSDLRNFVKSVENQTEYMSDTEVGENEEKNLQQHTQAEIPDIPQDLVPAVDSIEVPAPFLALVDHGETDPYQATNNFDVDRDVGIMSETDDECTAVAPGRVTTHNNTENQDNQEQERSTAISGGESGDTEIPEIVADADYNIVPAGDRKTYSNRNADCSDLYNEVGVKAEKEDTPAAPVAHEEATRMNINDCQEQEQNSAANNQIIFEPYPSGYYELAENSAPCFESAKESVDISENIDSTVDLADVFHATGFEMTNNQAANSDVHADNIITTSSQNTDTTPKSALNSDYANEDSDTNVEQNTSDYFVVVNEDGITCEEMNTLPAHASGISEGIHGVGMKGNTRDTFVESDLSSNETAEHTELDKDEDQEKHLTNLYDVSNKLLSQDLQLSESDDSSEDDAFDTCMTLPENDSERSFSENEEDMIKKATEVRLIPVKLQKPKSDNDNSGSKSGLGVSSHKGSNAVKPILAISSRLPLPPKRLDIGSSSIQKYNSTSSIQFPARQKRIPDLPGFPAPETRSLSIAEKSTHMSVKNRLSRSCQTIVAVNETSNLCQKKRFEESLKASAKKRLAEQLSRDNKCELPLRAPSHIRSIEDSSSNSGNEKTNKLCSSADVSMLKLQSTDLGSSYTTQVPPLGKSRIARTKATPYIQLSRDNKCELPPRAPSRISSIEDSSSNSGNEKTNKLCSRADVSMLRLHSTDLESLYTAQVPPLGKSRIARTKAAPHINNSTSTRMSTVTSASTLKSRQSKNLLQLLKKRRQGGTICKSKMSSSNLKREEPSPITVHTDSEERTDQMLPKTLKKPSGAHLQIVKKDNSMKGKIVDNFKSPPPPHTSSLNVVTTSTIGKNWPSPVISQQLILPQHPLNPEVQSASPFVPMPHQSPQLPPNFMEMVNQVVQNTLSQMLFQNSSNVQMPTSIPGPFSRPSSPCEATHLDTPSSCVSNIAFLAPTPETCELGTDNQENYDSPMSPSAEVPTYTEGEQRKQIFNDKEWKLLEKPESCIIKSWCSRFLTELCEKCDKDVINGEFEKISSKYFTQLRSMDLKTSGNMYMALASQMYDYVRLRDPVDLYDTEKPVKDDYVKLANIIRKMAINNFGEYDFSKLPELMFEFFEKQVMPNRFKHFGNEDLTLNKLGRFYSHLGKEFHLQSRAVDLLLQAVYYRPPHAFSLAVAMFKIDLPFIPSSDFDYLPLKLKCVLYCLLAPMRFKDAIGYSKLRSLISAIQFKVSEKPYKQFVTDIIDELKELESSSALKEGCNCLGALLMQQNPKENIQFIGEMMASVTRDWKNGTVNDGMFANFISTIGRVFGETMDCIGTEVLHSMTAIFENLIKGTKDSKFTNKAARETLNRVKNRLKTKPNWVWTWNYVKNRHDRPGGQNNNGQKKKYSKRRKGSGVSPSQASEGQVSSSTKPSI